MSGSERALVDTRFWNRRWSRGWARKSTILIGISVMLLGLVVVIGGFEIEINLPDTCAPGVSGCVGPSCTGGAGCIGPNVEYSPLHASYLWSSFVMIPVGAALTDFGAVWAFLTWRVKDWEWAAMYGLQPLAKRLEQLSAQGKIGEKEVEALIWDLSHPPAKSS